MEKVVSLEGRPRIGLIRKLVPDGTLGAEKERSRRREPISPVYISVSHVISAVDSKVYKLGDSGKKNNRQRSQIWSKWALPLSRNDL